MRKLRLRIACLVISLIYFFSAIVAPVLAATTYLYDPNGNMTGDGANCYTYNDANQLSEVKNCTTQQTIAQYVYDSDGNRIVKKGFQDGSLAKTTYTPEKSYETIKIASDSSTQNTTYYYANGEMVARKSPDGSKTYYQNDHLGSTTLLTDQTGALIEQTLYDPYGSVRSGGTQSRYLYTGKQKDAETGLTYLTARYYDSTLAHFTQPDTIYPDVYDPQQLNKYSYTRNNPMKYTDPSGHVVQIPVLLGMYALAVLNNPDFYFDSQNMAQALTELGQSPNPATVTNVALSAVSLAVPGGSLGESVKVGNLIRNNFVKGQIGEKLANIVKNTTRVDSISQTAKYRVPDILEKSVVNPQKITRIGDVKNVLNLRITNQLRDMSLTAIGNSIKPELIIDKATKISQKSLQWLNENNFLINRIKLR